MGFRSGNLAIVVSLLSFGMPGVAFGRPPTEGEPELIVDLNYLSTTWAVGSRYFPPGDCAIAEGCLGASGVRRLISFGVQTANISQTALTLGDPTRSPLFSYDACHDDYHLNDYSDYQLVDPAAGAVAAAQKTDWCVGDFEQYLFEPWVSSFSTFDCNNQGMSGGWADTYEWIIACQWIDITDVPGGSYDLRVLVNPRSRIRESDYGNNTTTVPVTIPAGDPDLILNRSLMASTWRIVWRFFYPAGLAVREGCVGGPGYRRLLVFDGEAVNLGPNDLFLGAPLTSSAFGFASAHGHYHLSRFVEYQILDPLGIPASAAASQDLWFPVDSVQFLGDPWVRPVTFYRGKIFDVNYGLQPGWAHRRFNSEACHWIDVTDVPDGPYTLTATINPGEVFRESDYSNNTASMPVVVAEPADGIPHRPDGNRVPGKPLRFEMGGPLEPPGPEQMLIFDDVSACPAFNYNLYYSLQPPGSYLYDGAICDIGTDGFIADIVPDPPLGALLWFLVVGREDAREGGHGFDSAGRPRPLRGIGIGACGVSESAPRASCPS